MTPARPTSSPRGTRPRARPSIRARCGTGNPGLGAGRQRDGRGPVLPDGVHRLGLDTVPDAGPALMVLAHQGILDLTLALNSLLPQVSEHARHPADRATATTCTALAAELGDCYTGRLKTFLNPLGRPEPPQPSSAPSPGRGAGGADPPPAGRHPRRTPAADHVPEIPG